MSRSSGARDAAVELAELLENARPVPFMRTRIRVDKQGVCALVDRIGEGMGIELRRPGRCGRAAAKPPAVGFVGLPDGAGSDLLKAAGAVREAVFDAYPVPLTDQVRMPRDRAFELASALRQAAA